ncbi:DUF4199 domain-containing protein [Mucilaginibacter sp. SP1R1]|uniref:DUF4199 domain-containing protein n=1 Tax=Mucilaginibacter sp. SP1R1 TaxID=2723091 RepID=UPI00161987B9|nr:DUF4199 domain-containing protein [Mucilaginibacter sp. SP1R1]MBB6148496.1 ABC-type Fe3+ transport system permease subunit [Mucilaginibacter sp. SP1R1]
MKNAFVTGLVIGIFSGTWLFVMHTFGYSNSGNHVAPVEYLSVLIPLVGVYLGVKSYKEDEKENSLSFFEALFQSFKILLIGGFFACLAGLVYLNYVDQGNNFLDFSGRLFGGLVIGILICVGVSAALMNRASKVDQV